MDGETSFKSQAGKFTCNITVFEWTLKDCLSLRFAKHGVKMAMDETDKKNNKNKKKNVEEQ